MDIYIEKGNEHEFPVLIQYDSIQFQYFLVLKKTSKQITEAHRI